ncbi:MAG TPA: FixH family protein [Gemmatimonadaceae bacterium]
MAAADRARGVKGCGRFAAAIAAVGMAATVSTGACQKAGNAAPPVDVSWTLRPSVAVVGPATLTVTLRDSSGPVQGARVSVEGHMSHAGMAPVLARAIERTRGTYEAGLAFTMAGDWVLLVHADLTDGRTFEHRIDIAGVRPAG